MSTKQLLSLAFTEDSNSALEIDPSAVKFFVGVRPSTMPENRFLEYAVVDRVLELADLKPRTVVLFDSSDEQVRLAKVICQHQREVGVHIVHLDGIPGSEISSGLRDAFFGVPVASHAAFISELALDLEIEEQKRSSSDRTIDNEERRRTRADGSTKEVVIGVAASTEEDE